MSRFYTWTFALMHVKEPAHTLSLTSIHHSCPLPDFDSVHGDQTSQL